MHRLRSAVLISTLGVALLGCGDSPAGPPPLAARYVLVAYVGRPLPVVTGTAIRAADPRTDGSWVTCTRTLLASELRFSGDGAFREVGWRDSTQTTCDDGTPADVRSVVLPGPVSAVGPVFHLTLYYGTLDPLTRTVVYLRREGLRLTVYRREAWRGSVLETVDETALDFAPATP
jgi:hypothetical protein